MTEPDKNDQQPPKRDGSGSVAVGMSNAFSSNNPKNLGQGLASGVSNVLAGAVGGVGVAVLSPAMGATVGWKEGGPAGSLVGLTGGAVVGVLGGTAMIVGGAVSGVAQIAKGVLAIPQQIVAPRQGKWWNDATGKWVYTDLSKAVAPEDDDDLLKALKDKLDANAEGVGEEKSSDLLVKDTHYYDVLEVYPSAEPSAIKRRYYVLAKKYHPDKVGQDDAEAVAKFKEIAEAYHILSDPELREKYDNGGREAIEAHEKENAQVNVEPAVIFAFLFGSDQFEDYIGRLATSTSAMIGDSPQLSIANARILQERRCTRLAKKLVDRIDPWMSAGDDKGDATMAWGLEAENLCGTSYGPELVDVIGMAYQLSSAQFLGALDAGVGMPSISKWAKAQRASMEQMRQNNKIRQETFKSGIDMVRIQTEAQERMSKATTAEEKAAIEAELAKASHESLLHLLFITTVVDITSTLHETCQMVFHDQHVDKTIRKNRGKAVDAMGKAFRQAATAALLTQEKKEMHVLYEEAAFAAMLETVKRKDESAVKHVDAK